MRSSTASPTCARSRAGACRARCSTTSIAAPTTSCTLARNRDDLRAIKLRQRVMVDVSRLSVGTTVLGEHWKMPVALAPTGLTGLVSSRRRDRAARAAQAAGVPFCLSTMSICSIEDVRAAVDGNVLVPAVPHARSRLHRGVDRACARGALLRARAHARSALAGAAAPRSEERPLRAAAPDRGQCVARS